MENFKKEVNDKIDANKQSIINFNQRIAEEKKEVKAEYQKKIEALNQKNTDLKKRLEDYKMEGKEDWNQFKTKFGSDLDNLGHAFANFFKKEQNDTAKTADSPTNKSQNTTVK
ncbi:hypothetical protein DNU06_06810 [Putridiphycobacter roseus]|uniref:Uncharacterized protein n=1 Tax=Putridiphycobacter roseus TaxID=2219161 RepID=A0A2W1NPH5_9FLAO|nr:hypothetical protein [Putridiphycobacter roseus]PZE17532.1 hypothetical protein DNU06_06810 [Putridiphycobacter roseus]